MNTKRIIILKEAKLTTGTYIKINPSDNKFCSEFRKYSWRVNLERVTYGNKLFNMVILD